MSSNHSRHFPGVSFSTITVALLVVSFGVNAADASKNKHHVKKCGLPTHAECVENEDCESGLCLFDIVNGGLASICEPGPLASTSLPKVWMSFIRFHYREPNVSPRQTVWHGTAHLLDRTRVIASRQTGPRSNKEHVRGERITAMLMVIALTVSPHEFVRPLPSLIRLSAGCVCIPLSSSANYGYCDCV
jgi:hypothetical protein